MGFFANLFGPGPVNIERRFKLHQPLGHGSMSKCWRATDSKTGGEVCVKVLDKVKLEQLLKRFVGVKRPDEGVIATQLDHPHIVKTYEHGITTKNEQFLVMEYLDGVSLTYLIETRTPKQDGRMLSYMIGLGEALVYLHEKNFIHRDLCPRNAIITKQGVAKLIDFGLAVPNTAEFRKPGNRTGTANYMAPELIRRAPTDERIDIFSYGVLVYESLTGGLPWDSAESMQAMLQHLNSPPRDPSELNPALPASLVKVLLRALERDPKARYQKMSELVGELRAILQAAKKRPSG